MSEVTNSIKTIINGIEEEYADLKTAKPVPHKKVLAQLLKQFKKIDFREKAGFKDENEKLSKKHYLVICIEEVLKTAKQNNWGLCKNHDFIYLYNGAYWTLIDDDELERFLGEAAEKMQIDKYDARHYPFRENLFKQFLKTGYLPKPEKTNNSVLINLKNGTYEIKPKKQQLRPPRREDFITYQLPFDYDPSTKAPIFESYLNRVQPDADSQKILAEYIAYLFIKSAELKIEKVLLLYGPGENGKSVFYDVVFALLGGLNNISSYSLQELTTSDNARAMIANKLLNYSSEINGRLETDMFKRLASGEEVSARLLYHDSFTLTDYAKLIFNCNELPRDVEHTRAFFRRFLIVPFNVTIPENEQDKDLSKKIITKELSGVFNWVLNGLQRLLAQRNFSKGNAVNEQLELFKKHSDSVQMFLEDEGYEKSTEEYKEFKELFTWYRSYCNESGYRSVSKTHFGQRLRNAGFEVIKKNYGMVVYVKK
jgi:putative DNA primase/helicase